MHRTAPGDSRYRAPVSGDTVTDLTPVREESPYFSSCEVNEEERWSGISINSDEEEGGAGVPIPSEVRLSPVATCLTFLFFAYEGAIASQAAAIRSATCPEVSITAVVALVSENIRHLGSLKPENAELRVTIFFHKV